MPCGIGANARGCGLDMDRVFVIAEAGVNHNGSLDMALRLVDAAAESGADAVKFQTFRAEKLVSPGAAKAEYQKAATGNAESQFEMIRKLELDVAAHEKLSQHCRERNILFTSTPFDEESISLLARMGMPFFKIPSGELTNPVHLRAIALQGRPVYLSTGMANLGEIETALAVLDEAGLTRDRVTLLHCTTEYPTPYAEVNLRAMATMRAAFPGVAGVGYSDHTPGIEIPLAAVALGATVIEKHFTLDRNLPGPDHRASLEPDELTAMVRGIRIISAAMGSGVKAPSPSELKNMTVARRSIMAACTIRKGERFSPQNLTIKRPGTGLPPMLWDRLLGVEARRDYEPDEMIEL